MKNSNMVNVWKFFFTAARTSINYNRFYFSGTIPLILQKYLHNKYMMKHLQHPIVLDKN